MWKKWKQDKANEGSGHCSLPSAPAPTPKDIDMDDSDTGLKQKVSRISFEFIKEILLANCRK